MELWIRSPNKEVLRKIDNIFISSYNNSICTNNDYQGITITLGKYKSRERCMQILDEIQSILYTPTFSSSLSNIFYSYDSNGMLVPAEPTKEEITQLNTFVYQMPEE